MKQSNILGTEKIGRLLMKFAIPGVIAMVVNSLYNIVDQIFIGRGVGYLGNGATTIIFPMTTLAMAFVVLIGDGAASYFSLKLGEKQDEKAAGGAAAGIIATIITGAAICLIYNIFLAQLCRLFGSSEAIMPYAIDYGRVISLGMPFFAVCCSLSSIIRADGSPKFNMIGLFVGTIINVTLDPIFIFCFKWGVTGAALATILGQAANAVLNIWYCFHMKSVRISRDTVRGCMRYLPSVLKLGVSSCLTQLALVVAIAARNNTLLYYGGLSKYGEDIPVTTLGITMKLFSIIMAVVIGLSTGAQPIFGYNYGSGQHDRVKQTYRTAAIAVTAVSVAAFLAAQLFSRQIIEIFGTEESELYYEFAVKTMKIFLMLIPTLGIQIMTGIFFQALGYPVQASLMSLSKQVIFQIPATLLLPVWLGVEGVLWAGPVSDLLAIAFTLVLLIIYWKKIFDPERRLSEQGRA